MNKKLKFRALIIIFLFLFCNINLVYAKSMLNQKKAEYLPIPEEAYLICSINDELIYSITTPVFSCEFYKYNPKIQKSEFLGKIDDAARYSGDETVLNNRYMLICYPVDKRVTKDLDVLQKEDETIRLICVDLKEKKTYEICRFLSWGDLLYIEPIDDHKFLIYARKKETSDAVISYVDVYDLKTGEQSTPITIENQQLAAATYDNGYIYTVTVDWGNKWPDWDQYQKPVYTFNCYTETGNLVEQKLLDYDILFPAKEEESDRLYGSFIELDVSGDYVKLNNFGMDSSLFRFNGNKTEVLYSGYRLDCWNKNGGFKEDKVYLGNINGDRYLLLKDQNHFIPHKNNKNAEVFNENIMLWDGTSDLVYQFFSDGNGGLKFVQVPIEKF